MSDLTKLLQEHSATKLLHDPLRHVCAGCGQAVTGTMAEHQADVLDLAGYGVRNADDELAKLAKAMQTAYDWGQDDAASDVNHFQRLHDKTGDCLRAASALVREQRATITAQDALIDGMRRTLTQQRAMTETLVALS